MDYQSDKRNYTVPEAIKETCLILFGKQGITCGARCE